MALSDVPRQLLIDELLVYHTVAYFAGASALDGGVPIGQGLLVNRVVSAQHRTTPETAADSDLQRECECLLCGLLVCWL